MVPAVSIHAPRAEGDSRTRSATRTSACFNPRPPRGGRRAVGVPGPRCRYSFNPRPPRGGRHARTRPTAVQAAVSIHAPRAEGDSKRLQRGGHMAVSIHAPRAEGDRTSPPVRSGRPPFQSTPPARRATRRRHLAQRPLEVSIHAPRAEGDGGQDDPGRGLTRFQSTPPARRATPARGQDRVGIGVSIHAPRAEGDVRLLCAGPKW